MTNNQGGYIADALIGLIMIIVIAMVLALPFVSVRFSNEVVSGIAYNTTNDNFISGATQFSVRASEDTYVSAENQSTYCLPGDSPYKELVNRAAQDKSVKIVVNSEKHFAFKAPWSCYPNIKVTEVK